MTETSRSPYTVIASVLGIGVAVMTSTSGTIPFFREHRSLDNTEAMLFVDHDQSQIPEDDPFLDQGMGPDDDIDIPRSGAAPEDLFFPTVFRLPVKSSIFRPRISDQIFRFR